jgi:hypothetical protein
MVTKDTNNLGNKTLMNNKNGLLFLFRELAIILRLIIMKTDLVNLGKNVSSFLPFSSSSV